MSITLITPVWNNASTIRHCLQSVESQTLSCQHILVDGGSTDGTLDILRREKSPEALLISEPDQGMYDAINKGIALATGGIVGVLNSDDFYVDKDVLQKVVEVFEDPAVDATYGDLQYVDRDDVSKVVRNWRAGPYNWKRFYRGWMPPHPTFFLRRRLYEQHGGYRIDLGSAADYELMLRMLLKHSASTAYLPEVMVHMRNDGMSNASLLGRIKANRNDRNAWRVNGMRPRPWTLVAKPLSKLGQWVFR